jgi:hypothetical protein
MAEVPTQVDAGSSPVRQTSGRRQQASGPASSCGGTLIRMIAAASSWKTQKDYETLDNYISVQAKRERQLLSHLTLAEKRQLNDLMRKCLASLDDESGPALRKK